MDKNQVVGHIKIDTILQKSESLTVVLFPNYEDRTCGVIDEIRKFCNIQQLSGRINFLMFCLKNKSNNNMLLEDLKERNIEAIKKRLGNVPINEFWLEYPSNFSPNALKMPIQRHLKEKYRTSKQKANILFDISTIPQSILFHLCENIKEFIRGDIIGNIYFAYCLPQKYS